MQLNILRQETSHIIFGTRDVQIKTVRFFAILLESEEGLETRGKVMQGSSRGGVRRCNSSTNGAMGKRVGTRM